MSAEARDGLEVFNSSTWSPIRFTSSLYEESQTTRFYNDMYQKIK